MIAIDEEFKMRKNRPPKNRRKSAKYRAKKLSRVMKRKAKSPHGKRSKAEKYGRRTL